MMHITDISKLVYSAFISIRYKHMIPSKFNLDLYASYCYLSARLYRHVAYKQVLSAAM